MTNKEEISLVDFLSKLMKKNIREDGRKLLDYRKIEIKTNTLSQANGSARVKLGDTEVFVGVKLGVGTPFPDTPNDGVLMVNAELNPLSSRNFDIGPPSPAAIELARVIDRAIRESNTIDTEKLCITPKEKVWMVFVDIYPVNDGGNLFDAGLLGAIAALKSARFPKYDKKEEKVDHRELTNEKIPLNDEPLMCTFGKIKDIIFVDQTNREEKVAESRLSVGISKSGNVCAMQKGGEGTFTQQEIMDCIKQSQTLSKTLRKYI